MNYYNYKITCSSDLSDILLAFLGEQPFDAFEETDAGLHAFIPEKDHNEFVENAVQDLQERFVFEYKKEFVPYKNWNKEWESNFEPVVVDDFCAIRADFHAPYPSLDFDLLINPKMAFGTGHHETTYMMVQMMRNVDFKNKKVLDFGCGTGVLAILASKLQASSPIDAIDIEEQSYLNTIENAENNHVSNIKPYQGSLEIITDSDYDVILANINRNVILEYLNDLYQKLNAGGIVLFSGFLKQDEALLKENALKVGFTLAKRLEKGKWICQLYCK